MHLGRNPKGKLGGTTLIRDSEVALADDVHANQDVSTPTFASSHPHAPNHNLARESDVD
jgi:hypothetical protein